MPLPAFLVIVPPLAIASVGQPLQMKGVPSETSTSPPGKLSIWPVLVIVSGPSW